MDVDLPLVLPSDVVLLPVAGLPADVRGRFAHDDGDYALTRPRFRTPSRVVDARTARLLLEFRDPKTIVDAVVSYSRVSGDDPRTTLREALPAIRSFLDSKLLAAAGSDQAERIVPSLEIGARVAGLEVLRVVQLLSDTEVYCARGKDGALAALKILRPGCRKSAADGFERERSVLERLDGEVGPALRFAGSFDGRPYLAIEWLEGGTLDAGAGGRRRRRELGAEILSAYARLHARGVVHADVHPRNVILERDGARLIDFGASRVAGSGGMSPARRVGIGYFLEPEHAAARLAGSRSADATFLGEQYAVAALLYQLLSGGRHYLDFSLDKEEMLRQIAKEKPWPFIRRGEKPWPEMEAVLFRALSKEPGRRFESMAEFHARFSAVPVPDDAARVSGLGGSGDLLARFSDAAIAPLLPGGRLFAAGRLPPPTASVNLGAAGIAYALYRLACVRDDAGLLSAADVWSVRAQRSLGDPAAFHDAKQGLDPETVGAISPSHTASGVHCVGALIGGAMGDAVSTARSVKGFIEASSRDCGSVDLTLGRSGTVLACALLRETIPDAAKHGLTEFGDRAAREVWTNVRSRGPIRDGGLPFLGMAHGWAGVLYAALRWSQASGSPLPDDVPRRLDELAACAVMEDAGAWWPRKIRAGGSLPRDHWGGWCHGSAGFVALWLLAHEVLDNAVFLVLAEKAAEDCWKNPEPRTSDLCCGLSGQSYALLNQYRHTGDEKWLERARALARKAAGSRLGEVDFPRHSLYKGDLGVALLAADLENPEAARMPFF